ncbi:PhzF family phenazine biosynthesis protein [Novosphingobium piscinae]|uniref:PhzF family phenazine biosynthesis protein n=1 Tax=Novosphingobium piscinae TaxID=1507448 RepID=A0A7X1FVW6_9SPHN|nr:PhzF family phenazine biosynthesis protein [Novosphingobium piscinae]MBC2667943.1 PhzF family phenazine biosynthesis protein [Novosphingobium piscinae]
MQIDLLDVFANGPLSGNPLAVVRGGAGLTAEAMLGLTRWLGFSETTFLLPPDDPAADYRVRIFYPSGELPFAGHPTLGTAAAWLAAGGVPRTPGTVVQECGVGLVPVQITADHLAFRAPPLRKSGPLGAAERAEAIRVAGVDPAAVVAAVHADNGPGWVLLHLASAEAVLAARPVARVPVITDVGMVGPHPAGSAVGWEVRALFTAPSLALKEDPVTGSLNAAVAQYLFGAGLARDSYVAAQGQCAGADGRVFVSQDAAGEVWVGGAVRMVAAGAALALG